MKRAACAILGLCVLVTASAAAHHSYDAFDRNDEMTIEGRLETLLYANPHVMLTIKAADGQAYTAEWGNLVNLGRAGVTKGTLKEGDAVVVVGVPTRDRSLHRLSLLKEIRRPGDGWAWKRPQPVAQ